MDSFDFACGLARIMDRHGELGLSRIVEGCRAGLTRTTDPSKPYRVLVHLIVDTVQPECVDKFVPRGVVTVREAARILMDLADHGRTAPQGMPVVVDRDLNRLMRRSIFIYFLHLLASDRYAGAEKDETAQVRTADGEPSVKFESDGVRLNSAAMRRWAMIVVNPELFRIVSRFLGSVPSVLYDSLYFRVVQRVVGLADQPSAQDLEFILQNLSRPGPVN